MSWFACSIIWSSPIAQRKRLLRSRPEYRSSRLNAQPNSSRISFVSLNRKVSLACTENWFRESGLKIRRTRAADHHQTKRLKTLPSALLKKMHVGEMPAFRNNKEAWYQAVDHCCIPVQIQEVLTARVQRSGQQTPPAKPQYTGPSAYESYWESYYDGELQLSGTVTLFVES